MRKVKVKEDGIILKANRRTIVSKLKKNAKCPECGSKKLACSLMRADDYENERMDIYIAVAHCNSCQFEWDKSIRWKKPIFKYWCNGCHKKIKTIEYKCSNCGSQDLDDIKKKPDIKFYFSKMEGWYLLPTIVAGRSRFPEDVGANTFDISFIFLCFEFCFQFWWNIADCKRISSLEDVLELAVEIDKLKGAEEN